MNLHPRSSSFIYLVDSTMDLSSSFSFLQSESLQAELDILKERDEELSVELELMKAEIDSGGFSGEGGGVTTYEMKQIEQQNDRLKEAVMKFRDLSQHEKQENVRLVKVCMQSN